MAFGLVLLLGILPLLCDLCIVAPVQGYIVDLLLFLLGLGDVLGRLLVDLV